MIKRKQKRIFVGLSGGVDSSVSAALLKEQGHQVTGIYIKPWQPDWTPCTWRDERRDAMRVAVDLDIPFQTLDLSEVYKKEVAEYMIAEYRAGRTPNPDIMCNRAVKFGAFWQWAKREGADAIATGHYARIHSKKKKEWMREFSIFKPQSTNANRRSGCTPHTTHHTLLAGADPAKDQSYFLWTLTQDDLAHTIFPVGGYQKSEVRKLAKQFGLPTAEKKDSQGICFLGEIDMKEFLGHYIKEKRGEVLDMAGEVIGMHDGAHLYTLGERRGFEVRAKSPEQKPLFVVAKDIEKNTITVAEKASDGSLPRAVEEVHLEKVNWIGELPRKEHPYAGRIRYRQPLQECRIVDATNDTARVRFADKQSSVAPGQSVVLYDGEVCLVGGVVADS